MMLARLRFEKLLFELKFNNINALFMCVIQINTSKST